MTFAHPHLLWLLLVLPPALLGFLWWAARKRRQLLTAFVQARLLPELTAGISPGMEQLRRLMLVAACAALIIAIARPQWGFTWEESRQMGLDIVVAIDTSKSMLAEDIAPNRLARAKLAALDLMQTAKSDRLGLVAFAGGAFLQCPMTIDDAAFRQSVEMLDVNTLPQGGTAIAEAIQTAQAAFKEGDSHKILVLFTDGEDQDSNAVEAAKRAAEAGLRIFTVGIGSSDGELIPIRDAKGRTEYVKDDAGNVVKSRLNETMLKEIAEAGSGFYLPMRGAKVIDTLYQNGLAPLPKSESEARLYKHYHEQYHWPLALAILLLAVEILLPARASAKAEKRVIAGSAKAATAALLMILALPLAATASTSSALKDYHAGRFKEAQEEYSRLMQKRTEDARLALNAGTAAYRGRNLEQAESLLSEAAQAPDLGVQQRAYYNRGNTRFMLGDAAQELEAKKAAWEKSLQDFASAIKLNEQDVDAKHNHEFVKQRLEELKQQEQQQDQQQDQQQKEDQQSQQQQNQDQSKQDQEQPQSEQKQEQQQDPSEQQDQQQNQQPSEQQKEPEQQQNQQTQSDQQKSGEQGEQTAGAQADPDQMTPEQAMRVLDTMKGEEKLLPLQPNEAASPRERKLKDW